MRLTITTAACGLILTSAVVAADKLQTFVFSKDDVGRLPAKWEAAKTGAAEGSIWKLVADPTTPSKAGVALAQTAKGPRPLFNLCVAEDTSFKNLDITVSLKAIRGEIDQGGGVVWRYQDANNYYVARYNPLESNYRVYKIVDGKRTQLDSKEDISLPEGQWHTLQVRHVGEQIECSLNGKKLLQAKDVTFLKPGKVGLWTKADAETHFDGLKVLDLGK